MPMATIEEQREYCRKWVARRRKEYFDNNGPCRRCWTTVNLTIHHVNPEEKESNRIWSWSQERRDDELKKCTVLCEVCHKLVTKYWYRSKLKDGTESMYQSGCRCIACRDAHRVFRNEERADKKSINPMFRRKCRIGVGGETQWAVTP